MNSLFDPECHGREAKEHEGRRRKERGRAREKGEAGGGPGMQGGPKVGVEAPQGVPPTRTRAEVEVLGAQGWETPW